MSVLDSTMPVNKLNPIPIVNVNANPRTSPVVLKNFQSGREDKGDPVLGLRQGEQGDVHHVIGVEVWIQDQI